MTTNPNACPHCHTDMRVLEPVMYHTPIARYDPADPATVYACAHDGELWPCRRRVDIHMDTHRAEAGRSRTSGHGSVDRP